jgi:hypothetical protein
MRIPCSPLKTVTNDDRNEPAVVEDEFVEETVEPDSKSDVKTVEVSLN